MENNLNKNYGKPNFRNENSYSATNNIVAASEPASNGVVNNVKNFATSKWGIITLATVVVASVGGTFWYLKKKAPAEKLTKETDGEKE